MGPRSARSCVQVPRFQSKTVLSLDQRQPATVRLCLVVVCNELGNDPSGHIRLLQSACWWLLSPPAGDQRNSIIQWLSRSNTDLPTSNISSSKAHFLFNSLLSVINAFSYSINLIFQIADRYRCSAPPFSRAALSRRPLGVLPDGGAQPVLLQSRVPPDVLQIL